MKIIEIAQADIITDAPPLSYYLLNILYFLLSFVVILAIIMTVIAGIKYFFSFGDTKKIDSAKKTFKNSVVGIIFALSALMIVHFVSQFFVK